MIEIILRISGEKNGSWFQLMDETSGSLGKIVRKVIEPKCGSEIPDLFSNLVDDRNRIAHSFQITGEHGEQLLATKKRENEGGGQFVVTEDFLIDFIKKNERLSSLLHECRGALGRFGGRTSKAARNQDRLKFMGLSAISRERWLLLLMRLLKSGHISGGILSSNGMGLRKGKLFQR